MSLSGLIFCPADHVSPFPPSPSQCGRGEVPSDPLRVCQLLWLGEELPAHAGGAGLQPGDVRLSVRQAELQPDLPQLASLRSVFLPVMETCVMWGSVSSVAEYSFHTCGSYQEYDLGATT